MRFSRSLLPLGLCLSTFAALEVAGCGSSDSVQSMFIVPAQLSELMGATFYNMPFPCDLRVVNGKVSYAGFPNPKKQPIIDQYAQFIDGKLDGFSPTAAGYLRFTGSLDATSLPVDPADAMTDGAAVQLVDITKASPDYQKRRPINVRYNDAAGVYWPAYTISYQPAVGYPLRPHTTYAVVVTDTLRSKAGLPVSPSSDVSELLGTSAASTPAHAHAVMQLAPFVSEMNYIFDLKRVVHFSIFTTNDPTAEYLAAAKALPSAAMAPTADPMQWKVKQSNADFDEYTGMYGPSPNYQAGTIPFTNAGDGGSFVDDMNGIPQVQNTFNLRFSLSVPNAVKCPVPSSGYPIVMYAHGTGGDYESYIGDGTAKSLTTQCLAVMGVDQIFHGARPGAPMGTNIESTEELLVFNFNNIESARTTNRQSGLDEMQRARLFTETKMVVPAAISKTTKDIALDGQKLMFFGHSQGSLNGPLFLAANPASRGGVLSGASGLIAITLLDKTQPSPSVAGLVAVLLGLSDPTQAKELGIDHPAIGLAQAIVDTVDPINYAGLIVSRPGGGVSKSIYQTEGVRADGTGDNYAPPRGGEALALAMGLGLMAPPISKPVDSAWKGAGLQPVTIPMGGLSGNIETGMGTGILAQFDPGMGEGHFVVFQVPQATNQAAGFLKNLAADPKGNVPPIP